MYRILFPRVLMVSLLGLFLFGLTACSGSWKRVVNGGSITQDPFTVTFRASLEHDLIIVPVEIGGEIYRFLFDTGAITAISKEVQAKMQFKVVTTGTIEDSQDQRQEMRYVLVPELRIGNISFNQQGAFVADLRANPILRCMNLDGIIGSNTMRLCNWTINYQVPSVTFTNQAIPEPNASTQVADFRPNSQFAMKLDMKVGSATLTNLTFDTGSNGGISVPQKIFDVLHNRAILDSIYRQEGYSQSGLMGRVVAIDEAFTYADSLVWGTMEQHDLELSVGHSGLVGNQLWSRYLTTIDWDRKQVFLEPVQDLDLGHYTHGFNLGEDKSGKVFIRAIHKEGVAEQAGLEALMEVLAIGHLDLEQGATFCDYLAVRDSLNAMPQLRLVARNKQGEQVSVILPRVALK